MKNAALHYLATHVRRLDRDIRALTIKVAAVAIRDVTILHELRALADTFRPEKPKGRLDLEIGLATLKTPKGNDMTTIQLTNEQQITVTLAPKTAKGKPAKIDGVPTWTTQSGDAATVTPAADGLSAVLRTVDDAEGTMVILTEGDADLGAGFEPLDETITLIVSAPKAGSLGVTVGEPTDKDASAPPAPGDEPPAARKKAAKSKK